MADDHRDPLGEPPSHVEVTVLRRPGGVTHERVIAALRRPMLLAALHRPMLLLALALVGVLAAGALALARFTGGGAMGWPGELGTRSSLPVHCISIAIVLHDARFLAPAFDHSLPCGRRAYTTAGTARSQ